MADDTKNGPDINITGAMDKSVPEAVDKTNKETQKLVEGQKKVTKATKEQIKQRLEAALQESQAKKKNAEDDKKQLETKKKEAKAQDELTKQVLRHYSSMAAEAREMQKREDHKLRAMAAEAVAWNRLEEARKNAGIASMQSRYKNDLAAEDAKVKERIALYRLERKEEEQRRKDGVAAMKQRQVAMRQQYQDEIRLAEAHMAELDRVRKESAQREKQRVLQMNETHRLALMDDKQFNKAMNDIHRQALAEDKWRTEQLKKNAKERLLADKMMLNAMSNIGSAMGRFRAAIFSTRNALQALAGSLLARTLIRWGVEYASIINTLSSGTGTVHRAALEFQFLSDFAKKYSVDLFAVSKEYAKFVAAVQGTSMAGEKARAIFSGVSKATLVLGLSADRTERAFLALSQMASQTYVTAENLRQQFAEHIPGAMIIAARAMGMTNQEFYTALYRGKILASELLPKLAAELEKIYGPHAERAGKTMIGSVNRLKTAWEQAWVAMANNAPGKVLQDIMQRLTDLLNLLREAPAEIEKMSNSFKAGAVAVFTLWGGAKMIGVFAFIIKNIKSIIALLKTPVGPIGALLTGTAAVAGIWTKRQEDAQSFENAANDFEVAAQSYQRAMEIFETQDQKDARAGRAATPAISRLQVLEPLIAELESSYKIATEMSKAAGTEASRAWLEGARKFWGTIGIEPQPWMAKSEGIEDPFKVEAADKKLENAKAILAETRASIEALRRQAEMQEKIAPEQETQISHAKEIAEAYWDMVKGVEERNFQLHMENGEYDKAYLSVQALAKIEGDRFLAINALEDTKNQLLGEERNKMLAIKVAQEEAVRLGQLEMQQQQLFNKLVDEEARKREALKQKREEQRVRLNEAYADTLNALAEIENKIDESTETPLETGLRRAGEYMRDLFAQNKEYIEWAKENNPKGWEEYVKNLEEARIKMEAKKAAESAWNKSMASEMVELMDEAVRDMQNTFSKFFTDIFTGSKNVWEDMGKALLDMFIKMLADMLAQWLTHEMLKTAITAKEAAKRAYIDAASSGSSEGAASSSSYLSYFKALKSLWSKYAGGGAGGGGWAAGAGSGAGAIGYGGSYGMAASGTTYGVTQGAALNLVTQTPTTAGVTYGASGTSSGMSAGATAGVWALVAVAVVMAVTKYLSDQKNKKVFGTAAGAEFDKTTGAMKYGWSGKLDKTGPLVAQKLEGLLKALESGTGSFITGMDSIVIKIRNDKKLFEAQVAGVTIGIFRDMNEAIVAAAKKAFSSATFAAAVDPLFQSMVANYQGKDPEAFAEAANIAKGILDVASGLSEMGLQIQNLIPSIHAMEQNLLSLGVAASDASMLAAQFAANSFSAMRRQITGEKESPKEELARRKAEAELFNAQLGLYRLEIQARIAKLKTDIALAKTEIDLYEAEGGAKREYLKDRIRLAKADSAVDSAILKTDYAELKAKYELWNKELEFLNKIDAELGKLGIDVGKIHLGGGGLGRAARTMNDAANRWKEGVDAFINALHEARLSEQTSPLTERERLSTQMSDFQKLLGEAGKGNLTALEALPAAYTALLESAKAFSGGGGGLGFLGLGDSFSMFFDALEALSIGFLNQPKPGKIYEKNVVFDERLNKTQDEALREKKKHRTENREQMKVIIMATTETANQTTQVVKAVNRLTRATEEQWGAA